MACVAALATATYMAAGGQALPPLFVGTQFDHVVQPGETWRSIGSRVGVSPATLATTNDRSLKTPLAPGDRLRIDARHLVPDGIATGIVINIPQRMLFLKEAGAVVAAYPVGLGRPDWPTFSGSFEVAAKEVDPIWDVPPSIQEELRRAGQPVVTRILPGPKNPLGKYWLGLSAANYGIHGTVAPLSIYRFESHGCIRLHPDDIDDLWHRVEVGTHGEIRYEPVLVQPTDAGIFLEVHPDIYRRGGPAESYVRTVTAGAGLADRVDWSAVRNVIAAADGRPHDIRLTTFSR
jgi:L,D-transpeptidase ErfK/SrfK